MSAAALVRSARVAAGLTQAQLAERMGVQQPVVARLERDGSNPRYATVSRALASAGQVLHAQPMQLPTVDEAQIAANLLLTPAQRMAAFQRNYAALRALSGRARRIEP